MSEYVYSNGVILPLTEACISPYDRGFLLGDGIFETIMACNGSLLFLNAHLSRLKKGLQDLDFRTASLQEFFEDINGDLISRLIKKNKLQETSARVRITISRGTFAGGLAPPADSKPTVIICAAPIDTKFIAEKNKKGISAITIGGIRPALPGVKSLNFMANIMGANMANKAGAGEGFFIAEDKKTVLEGTSSNIFILRAGVLQSTPAAAEPGGPGALAGVVRDIVLQMAAEAGLAAEEKWFTINDLLKAEEVFITNSISGIVPVIEVDSKPIADRKKGSITEKLQKNYEKKTSYFLLEKRK